jgi:hypothetical protein
MHREVSLAVYVSDCYICVLIHSSLLHSYMTGAYINHFANAQRGISCYIYVRILTTIHLSVLVPRQMWSLNALLAALLATEDLLRMLTQHEFCGVALSNALLAAFLAVCCFTSH